MTEWSMGEWFAMIGIPLFMGGGLIVSWLVGRVSDKWANRIAGFAVLATIATILNALMLWNEPVVRVQP